MNTSNNLAACEVEGLQNIFHYAITVIKVLQIAAPILLIIWGTIDLLKGVVSGDEKKISGARKPFIQRLITAILIFLIPWIVNYAIKITISDAKWVQCYKAASESNGVGDSTSAPNDPSQWDNSGQNNNNSNQNNNNSNSKK